MGLSRLLLNHRAYERSFAEHALGDLQSAPREKVAILTCMDARMDPARIFGLAPGDAHVIRNAGGRASEDAIRSLVVSTLLLGVQEIVVVQHTACGMAANSQHDIEARVKRDTGADARGIDFLTFDDLNANVRRDVQDIQRSPYLPKGLTVAGFVYDVRNGRLGRVTA
jgi:carbonic anhydrase